MILINKSYFFLIRQRFQKNRFPQASQKGLSPFYQAIQPSLLCGIMESLCPPIIIPLGCRFIKPCFKAFFYQITLNFQWLKSKLSC